jgi:zinc D-Ala-D-Ala dipeptidase
LRILFILYLLFTSLSALAQTVPANFVMLDTMKLIKLDIRYKTANNFTGEALYPSDWRTYLHPLAAERLAKAAAIMKVKEPRLTLVVLDATRPVSIQKKLYEKVRGTPLARYVSSSGGTSMHNYGLALDCTIIDETGKELDMGTKYDDFTALSEPRYEEKHLKEGKLTQEQYLNRRFLREVMRKAGLRPIQNEWWHFEAVRKTELGGGIRWWSNKIIQ